MDNKAMAVAKGSFSLHVYDSEGNLVQETPVIENTIVSSGRQQWFRVTPGALTGSLRRGISLCWGPAHIRVGSGTAPFTVDTVNLTSPYLDGSGNPIESEAHSFGVSSSESTNNAGEFDNLVANRIDNGNGTETLECRGTYGFSPGDFDNDTITELGFFQDGTMRAGQLLSDTEGNPSSITVQSDQQLVVKYNIDITSPNVYTKIADGSLTIKGVSQPYSLYRVSMYNADETATNDGSPAIALGRTTPFSNIRFFDSAGNQIYRSVDSSATSQLYVTDGVKVAINKEVLPTDFVSDDIRVITFDENDGTLAPLGTNWLTVTEGTKIFADDRQSSGKNVGVVMVFDNAIEKTEADSFFIDVEFEQLITQ